MSHSINYSLSALARICAFACALASVAPAQAALTTYSSASNFSSALTQQGTDTFSDIALGVPYVRWANAFSYTVSASSGLRPLEIDGASYIGNNTGYEWITFAPTSVNAIGGEFFAADMYGAFKAGTVTVRVFDSTGSDEIFTITPSSATVESFFGVTSTGFITRLDVRADQGWTPSYLAADNITVGTISAVPEPSSLALVLTGAGVVSVLMSRRRKT